MLILIAIALIICPVKMIFLKMLYSVCRKKKKKSNIYISDSLRERELLISFRLYQLFSYVKQLWTIGEVTWHYWYQTSTVIRKL